MIFQSRYGTWTLILGGLPSVAAKPCWAIRIMFDVFRCMHTIDWKLAEGHTGVVRCLQVDTWRIVSAADDRTIKVWNVDSLQRLCTLHSHEDGVTCVQFSDRQIVSGSYDKTVKLWDFSRF
ncbi:WD domain, G-beta repeat protein [Oesophagostomum dentatum]|uniref:WD domain, G-beta repeat protein n=1 Tax=Oesophagostomum dentatum TaxID=61180 RepID=A0A0B1T924_OESDE|nr:WD domain, G-beta repeat protein [Oesophagostomum dentatum]